MITKKQIDAMTMDELNEFMGRKDVPFGEMVRVANRLCSVMKVVREACEPMNIQEELAEMKEELKALREEVNTLKGRNDKLSRTLIDIYNDEEDCEDD